MKRLLLILTITLLGLAVENVYAQVECAESVECTTDVVDVELVTADVCCVEEPAAQESSFLQAYAGWFLILIMLAFPVFIVLIIVVLIIRNSKRKRNDELEMLKAENKRLQREVEIAHLKEENERLRNNQK